MKKCIAGVNCIIGDVEQDISEFYAHKQMADGHVNRCKTCCKALTKHRQAELEKDPEWLERERERQRKKQARLYGDGRYKPTTEKKKEVVKRYLDNFPEKYAARKATTKLKPSVPGNELHHWSYNDEHLTDVIELSREHHDIAHRFIVYDQERKMYRAHDTWDLLHTKEVHYNYIKQHLQ